MTDPTTDDDPFGIDDGAPDVGGAFDLGDDTADDDDEAPAGDQFADPDETPTRDPFAEIPEGLGLEEQSKQEWTALELEAKAEFKRQDQQQNAQFANLYDARFYNLDVYRTAADCERGKQLMARVLGVDYERSGSGSFFRNGHKLTKALERVAGELGIDVSDLA
jgi:hypothetical protein